MSIPFIRPAAAPGCRKNAVRDLPVIRWRSPGFAMSRCSLSAAAQATGSVRPEGRRFTAGIIVILKYNRHADGSQSAKCCLPIWTICQGMGHFAMTAGGSGNPGSGAASRTYSRPAIRITACDTVRYDAFHAAEPFCMGHVGMEYAMVWRARECEQYHRAPGSITVCGAR